MKGDPRIGLSFSVNSKTRNTINKPREKQQVQNRQWWNYFTIDRASSDRPAKKKKNRNENNKRKFRFNKNNEKKNTCKWKKTTKVLPVNVIELNV